MRLVNIGFGNMVSDLQVVSVVSADAAPIKRMIQSAREQGLLVDATSGRKTKSVITTSCQQIILAALTPETLMQRFNEVGGTEIE